jgi:hypothetical protein
VPPFLREFYTYGFANRKPFACAFGLGLSISVGRGIGMDHFEELSGQAAISGQTNRH